MANKNNLTKLLLELFIGCIAIVSYAVEAVPEPTVSVTGVPAEQFVGEQFCFTATLTTTADTGYGPYFQLFLKPDFDLASATLFGSAASATLVGTFPSITTDPISGDPVSGEPGARYYNIQLPVGSVTNGSAPLNTSICIDLDATATPNVLQNNAIQVTPVFEFGDSATGTTAITGTTISEAVTPTVIIYTENDLTDEAETPPGPVFQYDIALVGDIASEITVTPIAFPQVKLTDNRQFVGPIENVGGVSCVATVTNSDGQTQSGSLPFAPTHMATPGGFVDVSCNNGTGTSGSTRDVVITIPVYPVDHLDAQSCSFENTVDRHTSKHVVLRKSADKGSIKPGDLITYSLSFAVSEYINAENITITDVMPDGLTYIGVQSMTIEGANYSVTPVVSNGTPSGGETTVSYDLSAAYGATFAATTTGVITYTATVDQHYNNTQPLRARDSLVNSAVLSYDVENGATSCSDDSAATLVVIPLVISKTLINPSPEYQPGQLISFRLRMDIPSGDTKNIVFSDFLPLPALKASGIDTTLNLSSNINISYGPNDTMGLTPDSITTSSTTNGIVIKWPDVDSEAPQVIEIDIEDLIISSDPYQDNLFLTNIFEQSSSNTAGSSNNLYDAVSFTLRAPVLSIDKKVSPSSQVDAGDTVNYTIDVTNDGGANAYDTKIRDVLPDNISSCTINSSPAGSGDLFTSPGYLLSSHIAPGATVSFAFSCLVDYSIQVSTRHRNTAYASWASAANAQAFSEVSDFADFSTAPANPQKSIISTNQAHTSEAGSGVSASPRTVSIGETIRYQLVVALPEGTSNAAYILDYIPEGLQYLPGTANVALISNGGITSSFACTSGSNLNYTGSSIVTPTCGINATGSSFSSGTDVGFLLGNLVNNDNDPDDEYIVLEFDALVLDNITNQQALKTYNRFRVRLNNAYSNYSSAAYHQIAEPRLTLTPTVTATTLSTINMKMLVSNVGNAAAFQVAGDDNAQWSVTLQDGLKNINNITLTTTGNVYENNTTTPITAADFVVSGLNNETLTLLKPMQLDPNADITFSFDVDVVPGVTPGNTLASTVMEYASQVTGGLAENVRTGIGLSTGSGNSPINSKSKLDDYRTEAALDVYHISGKVYHDTNSNSAYTVGEKGIPDVTVVLYNTNSNTCRSVKTNGSGDYAFFPVSTGNYRIIESALQTVPAPSQCPPAEKDPAGYSSTSGNIITVSVINQSLQNQDFGDISGPAFSPNHTGTVLPGNVIFYAHEFTTPESGSVRFIPTESGQVSPNWSSITYRDYNCDGVLNGTDADAQVSGMNLGINAGEQLCIINKVFAGSNVSAQDRYLLSTTASFTYTGGITESLIVNDVTTASGNVSPTQPASTDTPVTPAVGASRLVLSKTVKNLYQLGSEETTKNEANPGDFLEYRISYRNTGTGPITDLKINDNVPDYSAFVLDSARCDVTPPNMTCTPIVGPDTSIRWDFTGAPLLGGESGSVSFQVMVDPQ